MAWSTAEGPGCQQDSGKDASVSERVMAGRGCCFLSAALGICAKLGEEGKVAEAAGPFLSERPDLFVRANGRWSPQVW
jgi:hypothetical protein